MKKSEQAEGAAPPETRDPTRPVRRRRPLALRLIFWLLLLWTVLGWLRFAQTLQNRDLILSLTSTGIYAYLLGAGAAWGLIGLPAFGGLALRTAWARAAIGAAAVLYPAIYWFERLALWRDQDSQANWPFMLALTLLWLGVAAWGLLARPGRNYFRDEKVD
jgi:hypothetical protein